MMDLRSDTVTRPTSEMLQAMMAAEVGDDVYGEDATVNRLQAAVAQLFGKEAALFCPTGTMANQLAIKVHTQPGDELLCAEQSHVYQYEGGGVAFHSGVQVRLLPGDRGRLHAEQLTLNADDVHFPATRLVCLENTANRGGGSVYALAQLQAIRAKATALGIKVHIDGARIWNAIVAANYTAAEVGANCDTIAVCLSKGLGAPVGSLLVGSEKEIQQAKRYRKLFGGGMRQAGYLAAAGWYALHHHVHRLQEDHRHAQQVGVALARIAEVMPVETNIVIARFATATAADGFIQQLATHDIRCGRISPTDIRMVFHLDVDAASVNKLIHFIQTSNGIQH